MIPAPRRAEESLDVRPVESPVAGNPLFTRMPSPVNQSPELLRRLLRAKDRMDAAPHEDWPVDRLAEVSAVSKAHFARSFKDAFGVPPHRYLLTRRIERAAALLRETEWAVTDIALQTGWRSIGTFGRIFREITGQSPGECRKRARAATDWRGVVPECVVRSLQRPDLKTAVSEKRRQNDIDTVDVSTVEVP